MSLDKLAAELAGKVEAEVCRYYPMHEDMRQCIESAIKSGMRAALAGPDGDMLEAGTLHDTLDEDSDIGADVEGIWNAMAAVRLRGE